MSFFMSTTEIPSEKTAAEISSLLAKSGATDVMITYANREAVGLSFRIEKNGITIPFKLPIKWEKVCKAMWTDNYSPSEGRKAQAKRTAWRIILRWIQAQLALIETGSVAMEEVFLPYAQQQNGQTIYEAFAEKKFLALEAHS